MIRGITKGVHKLIASVLSLELCRYNCIPNTKFLIHKLFKSAHHTSNQTNINVMGNSKQHQCKNGGQSKIFKTLTCVIRLALVNQLQKCISKLNALETQ